MYLGSVFIPEKYVIRVLFVSPWTSLIPLLPLECPPAHKLNVFEPLSIDEVEKVIRHLTNKTCALDQLPTWLLKQNLPVVVPTITRIVNMSLRSGDFPDLLKKGYCYSHSKEIYS